MGVYLLMYLDDWLRLSKLQSECLQFQKTISKGESMAITCNREKSCHVDNNKKKGRGEREEGKGRGRRDVGREGECLHRALMGIRLWRGNTNWLVVVEGDAGRERERWGGVVFSYIGYLPVHPLISLCLST